MMYDDFDPDRLDIGDRPDHVKRLYLLARVLVLIAVGIGFALWWTQKQGY